MPTLITLSTDQDMRWLFDVHCPDFRGQAKSAVLEGNEDSPDKITLYRNRRPAYNDEPIREILVDRSRRDALEVWKLREAQGAKVQTFHIDDNGTVRRICRLIVWDGMFIMEGLTGVHGIHVHATDVERLAGHWRVFSTANEERAKLDPNRWTPKQVPERSFHTVPWPPVSN